MNLTLPNNRKMLHKNFYTQVVIAAVITLSAIATSFGSYLHAKGSKLYNDKDQVVRLTGVNWFGFETSNLGAHGLWARDYHGILLQIKSMGFNCIRMPFCDAMLRDGVKVQSINFYGTDPFYPRDINSMNLELKGLSPLQMMDQIIHFAREIGLVIILDNHSREPDGYMNEKVWYTDKTSEKLWIDDWVMLADRYKNNSTVIGFDLENEPHGKTKDGGSTWGTGAAATDWNVAAQKCGNAILAINPDALIIIEGVEQVETTMYWWGGNLRGVKTSPIVLSKPEKLMYSPHEYGPEVFQQPWFDDAAFPGNMEGIWNDAFGFVAKDGKAPLLVGEFGIKDLKSYGGKSGTWFTTFLKYMADNFLSWTFWCFNPNSGDTGGILSYDWLTVEQWKLDALKPWCAPLINEPLGIKLQSNNTLQKNSLLRHQNGTIDYLRKYGSAFKLEIVNMRGEVVGSSATMSLQTKKLSAGAYTAVLYSNATIVETMRFMVD